ncbi:MAG: beta-ketoacyl-ACP synthase II [Thermoanaerobacterales bacterium]|nr:beta-ketoacyl-ACP synthase II [Thermoanaerobacterales bacterium]
MRKKRIVITGLGVVTPIGIGIKKFWFSLVTGKCGIDRITRFDCRDFTTKIAAEVNDFAPEEYMSKKELKHLDRFTQYAIAATKMALEDSKIGSIDTDRIGVIMGCGIGGSETWEAQHSNLIKKGPKRVSPFFIPMMIANMASGQISMHFNLKGPNFTIVNACASGTNAIGEAFKLLQKGDADIMVAGGTEAPITPLSLAGFSSMRALSVRNDEPSKASRPFDKERDGFVMGEGAGIVVMETLENALKRSANIYAEVIGYGSSADAYHLTQPSPDGEGTSRALKAAMDDAGIVPEQVDYINAHGTSTELNDKFETIAIKNTFGKHAYNLAISSTKSMTGHLLGAAGAVELVATTLTVFEDTIPPTINYEFVDPECDLDYVPNKAIQRVVNIAVSNSMGFGGHNACIILNKIS